MGESLQYVKRIILLECQIEGDSSLSLSKDVSELIFSKCSFEKPFRFSNFNGTKITLNDCKILDAMIFFKNDAIKVKIKQSSLKENNRIAFTENENLLVNIYGVNNVVSGRNEGIILLDYSSIEALTIGSSQLKVLKIASDSCVSKCLRCSNLHTDTLEFSGVSFLEDSTALFEENVFDKCEFNRIVNKTRYIQFNSVYIGTSLKWSKFDLANTYFNDFDIRICSASFDKVNFLGAHLNAIEWGEDLSKLEAPIATITQLKSMYDEQKFFHLADLFYSLEMNRRRNDPNLGFAKKIVSFVNWKASNYGMSYTRPIIILLISAFAASILDMTLQGNFNIVIDSKGDFLKTGDIILNILNRCSDFIIPFSYDAFSNGDNKLFQCNSLNGIFALLYIIWSSILIWHIIVSVKRINKR